MASSTNKGNISSLMLFLSVSVLIIIVLLLSASMVFKGFSAGKYENPDVASKVVKGTVFDRNGRALAIEVPTYTLIISSEPENLSLTCELLSLYTDMTPDEAEEKLTDAVFPVILTDVTSDTASEIEKSVILEELPSCIEILKDYSRIYPSAFHSAQLIHETEKVYGPVISPRPGFNESITYGNDVYLTIDIDVQYLLDLSVQQVFDYQGPDYVAAFILDIETSQLLACSTYPFYDLNETAEIKSDILENRAFVSEISTENVKCSPVSCILKVTEHNSDSILDDYTLNGDYTKDLETTVTMTENPDMATSMIKLFPEENPEYLMFIGSSDARYNQNSNILETIVSSLEEGLAAQGKI